MTFEGGKGEERSCEENLEGEGGEGEEETEVAEKGGKASLEVLGVAKGAGVFVEGADDFFLFFAELEAMNRVVLEREEERGSKIESWTRPRVEIRTSN